MAPTRLLKKPMGVSARRKKIVKVKEVKFAMEAMKELVRAPIPVPTILRTPKSKVMAMKAMMVVLKAMKKLGKAPKPVPIIPRTF